jgi:maleamate amidohydrolase
MATLQQRPLGLGTRAALLVIDATLGFTDASSALYCGTGVDAALDNILRLQAAFRAAQRPIAYSTNAYASGIEASVFREKLPQLNELRVGGRWAQLHPRLHPRTEELQFRKIGPSAFFDTLLRGWVQKRQIDALVLCGFSTSGCVRASSVDALQCNLRVTVVSDACADRDPEAHAYNLRDLGLKTGDVLDTDTVLSALAHP